MPTIDHRDAGPHAGDPRFFYPPPPVRCPRAAQQPVEPLVPAPKLWAGCKEMTS